MLTIQNVSKQYRKHGHKVDAALDISLKLKPGDFTVLHGPSGSGKSTILLIAGGMLAPDVGDVRFQEHSIYGWSPRRRNRFRRSDVGFVFQRFHLAPYLSVRENIRLPLALQGRKRESDELIGKVAERLGIHHRLEHRPQELSVGELQRAAVARAIVGGKSLILADEPTGNLDEANARIVADILKEEAERGRVIMMVTHNPALMDLGNRSLSLEAGHIVSS